MSRVTISVFLLRDCEDEVDVMFVKVDHEERNDIMWCRHFHANHRVNRDANFPQQDERISRYNFTRMKERKEMNVPEISG